MAASPVNQSHSATELGSIEAVSAVQSTPQTAEATQAVSQTSNGVAEQQFDEFQESQMIAISRPIRWRLYLSHFLSTWNSRSFEFAAVLFFAHLYPNTLLYLSIYAMVRSASAIITSTPLGRAIDRCERLLVVRWSIVAGRIAVILSALGFWGMGKLERRDKTAAFVMLVLMSCVEKAASVVNLVSIERDWVVVIEGGQEEQLQKMNARMRRIDLICKLAGPLFIALVDGASTTAAIWLTMALNALSLPIEYFAIAEVHSKVPALNAPKQVPVFSSRTTIFPSRTPLQRLGTSLQNLINSYSHYAHHSAFLPSLSLSLLYLTVLSFSGQMITYLTASGYSPSVLGGVRTLNVAFELSATWLAPRLMSRITPHRAGLWFISLQATTLLATAAVFYRSPSYPKPGSFSASVLASGTILSRIGLWGYDLCASVIVQMEVRDETRGAFSATEQSLQNAFELASYALTIGLPRPEQFGVPVGVSVGAVGVASGVYAGWLRGRRGHLVHTCVGKV